MIQRITGSRGRLRVGYQTAATVTRFALSVESPGVWKVEGAVADIDAFWLSQTPMSLEVEVGAQRWLWQTTSLAVEGTTLSGTVSGSPARR